VLFPSVGGYMLKNHQRYN